MNTMVTEFKNHDCLESDIIPVTDIFITHQNINSYRLESDNMVIYTEELFLLTKDYYINKMMNCSEISSLIGIHKATINYWLKKSGVPIRDKNTQRKGKKRKPFTKEHCDNISRVKKGKVPTCAFRDKHGENNPFYGKKHSAEKWIEINNMKRQNGTFPTGEKNGNWKGGLSQSRSRIYAGIGYKKWREAVFKRDDYTCKTCGDKTGHNLQAHHIVRFSRCLHYNMNLLFDVNNGITLCEKCHDELHRKIKDNVGGGWHEFPEAI